MGNPGEVCMLGLEPDEGPFFRHVVPDGFDDVQSVILMATSTAKMASTRVLGLS